MHKAQINARENGEEEVGFDWVTHQFCKFWKSLQKKGLVGHKVWLWLGKKSSKTIILKSWELFLMGIFDLEYG
jgi:hypothetical protein